MPAVSLVASLVAMVVRLRRAGSPTHEQIKWFLYAGVITLLAFLIASVSAVPLHTGVAVTGFAIPVAVAIAVLRHRLYDIDRLIRRTLVYGLLSGVLGLMYLAAVLLLGQLFGGVAGDPSWAVAGATLAVAALFQPSRHRIKEAVDRRLNRRRLDAVRTVGAFTTNFATRWTWTPSRPSCWRSLTRPWSRPESRFGFDPPRRLLGPSSWEGTANDLGLLSSQFAPQASANRAAHVGKHLSNGPVGVT